MNATVTVQLPTDTPLQLMSINTASTKGSFEHDPPGPQR